MSQSEELGALLSSIINQLSISDQELGEVLVKMDEAKLTVATLSSGSMDCDALYKYGVQKHEDAELILAAASRFSAEKSSSDGGRPRIPLRQHSDSFDGITGNEPLNVLSLSTLLATVYNWETLGIKLGLQMHQLEKIRLDFQGDLEMCKNRLFDLWLRQSVDPSWGNVVTALEQMEENNLASKIRRLFLTEGSDVRYSPMRQSSVSQSDSPVSSKRCLPHPSSIDSENGDTAPTKVVFVPIPVAGSSSVPTAMMSSLAAATAPALATAVASANVTPQSTPSAAAASDTSQDFQLAELLKSMTIEDAQQIDITCKVYNAETNKLIESTPAPRTRDIKMKPRKQQSVQEFSSDIVPIGTSIRLEVSANCKCYLYIINIGTSGKTTFLLPNKYDTNHFRANQTYYLPDPDYGFDIEGPPGKETIQILAFSEKQSRFEELARKSFQDAELYRDISIRRKRPTAVAEVKKGFALIEFNVR